MNMKLGCREEVNKAWFYYLMDGTKLTKEEWTSIVKRHIKEHGNEQALNKIMNTIKLWNKKDSIEDVALHVYAAKYCADVQQVAKRERVKPKFKHELTRKESGQLMLGGIS
ncbi:hypothetical protein [Niameybacter massiliensis]|uniref:hypothetical protein n=2 Tax=Niameybacter massiliensis TaxID=1658108 RepID=UPI0006B5BE03|nr:hypothetical protein [Niameybacter massiliensis]